MRYNKFLQFLILLKKLNILYWNKSKKKKEINIYKIFIFLRKYIVGVDKNTNFYILDDKFVKNTLKKEPEIKELRKNSNENVY